MSDNGIRCARGRRNDQKVVGNRSHAIAVTHPNLRFIEGQSIREKARVFTHDQLSLAVLALVGSLDAATQKVSHQLHAVTNP